MAVHSCWVVKATEKNQKSQYLNVLNHETKKERKYVVFASNNIIQGLKMNVKELLPIGSVVLMNGGTKKLMIYGVKQTDQEDNQLYDYIGVVYPEGNMGEGTQFLFNHEDINKIVFYGYSDVEREEFIEKLEAYYMENR